MNYRIGRERSTVAWPDGTETDLSSAPTSERKFIRDLSPGIVKSVLIGLVIAKQAPKSYPDKKNPGELRYLLSFTLRDTPLDFVNVVCWGKDDFILQLASLFKIGDIVEVRNSLAQPKQTPEIEEKFRPWTPSQYQLTVSENHASVQLYNGWDFSEFSAFAYLPVREGKDYYTLGDVIANAQVLTSSHVNLLAVVKQAGETKDIMTKRGKKLKRKELKLFDDTCYSFPFVLWEDDLIELAESWRPRDIVLFITDVRISFDDFRKGMIATCDSKTIVTVNPDTPEARHLYQYAQSADIPLESSEDLILNNSSMPDVATIKDFYTIEMILEKLGNTPDPATGGVYGYTFAVMTNFDIDNESAARGATIRRCTSCRRRYNTDIDSCSNPICLSANADVMGGEGKFFEEFDIRISLGDATGGIDNIVLQQETVTKMLGIQVQDFVQLSSAKKTELKWIHLMERHKVYFKYVVGKEHQPPKIIAFDIDAL